MYFNFIYLDEEWKLLWYRLVDGYDKDETKRKRLLASEKAMFDKFRKIQIENNQDWVWGGSKEENREADWNIARDVKETFRMYEKGTKRYGNFFKF